MSPSSARRRQIGIKGELLLAIMPTLTVLGVLGLVETLSNQRLLFASLAASAFLIYLDPSHETNSLRTLISAQIGGAVAGSGASMLFGAGYVSAGTAMVVTIVLMIVFDRMHPPAVATALSFAFGAGPQTNLVLFGLAVGILAALVLLQKAAVSLLARRATSSDGATRWTNRRDLGK